MWELKPCDDDDYIFGVFNKAPYTHVFHSCFMHALELRNPVEDGLLKLGHFIRSSNIVELTPDIPRHCCLAHQRTTGRVPALPSHFERHRGPE